MSLVNDMLQDLARRRELGDDDQLFRQLAPVPTGPAPSRWRRWVVPIAMVFGAGMWLLVTQHPTPQPALQTLALPALEVAESQAPADHAVVSQVPDRAPQAQLTTAPVKPAPAERVPATSSTVSRGSPAAAKQRAPVHSAIEAPTAGQPASTSPSPEALYQRGLSEARSGNIGSAIKAFAEATQAAPKMAPAWRAWASELLAMDDLGRASQVLQRARAAVPGDPVLQELQARLWLQQGRPQAARALLEQASPPVHRYPGYHALLAGIYQQLGDTRRATSTYRRLLATDAHVAVWWVGLAVTLDVEAEAGAAAQAYARALSLKTLPAEVAVFAADRHRFLVAGQETGP